MKILKEMKKKIVQNLINLKNGEKIKLKLFIKVFLFINKINLLKKHYPKLVIMKIKDYKKLNNKNLRIIKYLSLIEIILVKEDK